MHETNLPTVTWQEFNALRDETKTKNEDGNFVMPFDWGTLPILDMGSTDTAGKLVNATMARFPERLMLECGREVQMASLEQRDMNANRLTGYLHHPSHYVHERLSQLHQKWAWSKGHIVVLPPQLLGGMALAIDQNKNKVNAQCAALPPIESVAAFDSGPLAPSDDRSSLLVLWYRTSFGLNESILKQLKSIDWPAHAYSYEF